MEEYFQFVTYNLLDSSNRDMFHLIYKLMMCIELLKQPITLISQLSLFEISIVMSVYVESRNNLLFLFQSYHVNISTQLCLWISCFVMSLQNNMDLQPEVFNLMFQFNFHWSSCYFIIWIIKLSFLDSLNIFINFGKWNTVNTHLFWFYLKFLFIEFPLIQINLMITLISCFEKVCENSIHNNDN